MSLAKGEWSSQVRCSENAAIPGCCAAPRPFRPDLRVAERWVTSPSAGHFDARHELVGQYGHLQVTSRADTRSEGGGGAHSCTLNNCTLNKNSASRGGGGAYSGTLNNCTLTGNSAVSGGGAAFAWARQRPHYGGPGAAPLRRGRLRTAGPPHVCARRWRLSPGWQAVPDHQRRDAFRPDPPGVLGGQDAHGKGHGAQYDRHLRLLELP